MKYEPQPIDTSQVELSAEVLELIEQLAANVHDHWALKRTSEGWTYGAKRDDELREHPCLVSYDDLPDSEKEYDRTMARETIKAIVALGYRIEK